MFTTGLKSLESIPPKKNALFQHVRGALLVIAFMWEYCLDKSPVIPDPRDWEWEWNEKSKSWVPY